MTQHLSQLKALVEALEAIKNEEEAFSIRENLNRETVNHRIAKEALTHAPELLKWCEGMQAAKALLAEVGNIMNGIRARDGAPEGYSHKYFNELVELIHEECDGDCLTYFWKHRRPSKAGE